MQDKVTAEAKVELLKRAIEWLWVTNRSACRTWMGPVSWSVAFCSSILIIAVETQELTIEKPIYHQWAVEIREMQSGIADNHAGICKAADQLCVMAWRIGKRLITCKEAVSAKDQHAANSARHLVNFHRTMRNEPPDGVAVHDSRKTVRNDLHKVLNNLGKYNVETLRTDLRLLYDELQKLYGSDTEDSRLPRNQSSCVR
jgi:hypothetical protein